MARARSWLVLALSGAIGAMSAMSCADTDPRYGPPQGIRGRKIDFGIDASPVEAGPSTKPAPELFADLFATLTDSTEAKGSKCIPCHASTQAPVFMAVTAEETRAKFKALGFDRLETSRFYLKGQHTGNALKPEQKALTQQWAAAEAAGGDGG